MTDEIACDPYGHFESRLINAIANVVWRVVLCVQGSGLFIMNVKLTKIVNKDSQLIWILTHWGQVTQFGDIDLGQHWLR